MEDSRGCWVKKAACRLWADKAAWTGYAVWSFASGMRRTVSALVHSWIWVNSSTLTSLRTVDEHFFITSSAKLTKFLLQLPGRCFYSSINNRFTRITLANHLIWPPFFKQTCSLTIMDDIQNPSIEGSESFVVFLSSPQGAVLQEPYEANVIIADTFQDSTSSQNNRRL